MQRKSGNYIIQKSGGETYKAFVPLKLPPVPEINIGCLYLLLEKATRSLSELNSISNSIPNPSLFMYMYVRKEALLSSQIEGTQSSFSDLILFENKESPNVEIEDVEEVSNYVKAIKHGLKRVAEGFPLSLRLLREIHGILLAGVRGSKKAPGNFRTSQNWIGGTRPGNAIYVPPPPEELKQGLSDFEHFLYDETLPVLIKAGLAHVQFETLHPFLDGNGRLGRLLVSLLLCVGGLMDEPILYLSLYLKKHRQTYYDLLQQVREKGTWEVWLEFFLEGVEIAAKQAVQNAKDINQIFIEDAEIISSLGRGRFSCILIHEYMKRLPQVNVVSIAKALDMSAPTVRTALNNMVKLGVIKENTGKKRDKVYVYKKYLSILENGVDPIKL